MSEKVVITKQDVGVVKVGFKELHVNPTPKKKEIRNLARIVRLTAKLDKKPEDWPERAAFERELKRRTLQAQLDELKGGK